MIQTQIGTQSPPPSPDCWHDWTNGATTQRGIGCQLRFEIMSRCIARPHVPKRQQMRKALNAIARAV